MNRRSVFSWCGLLLFSSSLLAEVVPADRAAVIWSLLLKVESQEGMIHFCDNWAFRLQFKSQYANKDLPRSVNLGQDSNDFAKRAEEARTAKAIAKSELDTEMLKVIKDLGYKKGAYMRLDQPTVGMITIEGEKVSK